MNFLSRHSGAGRNPANQIRREAAQQSGLVRYAGCVLLLDSGLMELLAIRLSWQTAPAKSLVIPLNGGGNQAPSPFQGEGWDGGDISNLATNLDVSNAA
ncbi:hypothetical protein GALL_101270 [mine drainage metagenome]|uniref:Uncharacterized protein n=1 Tax=mine drainage metagenome TaxID=410659 RepID=A0A1J5SUZ5_9ZZZZ